MSDEDFDKDEDFDDGLRNAYIAEIKRLRAELATERQERKLAQTSWQCVTAALYPDAATSNSREVTVSEVELEISRLRAIEARSREIEARTTFDELLRNIMSVVLSPEGPLVDWSTLPFGFGKLRTRRDDVDSVGGVLTLRVTPIHYELVFSREPASPADPAI